MHPPKCDIVIIAKSAGGAEKPLPLIFYLVAQQGGDFYLNTERVRQMANERNLRPSEYKLSREEAKKGGKKSGESRRKAKTIRTILTELLSMNAADSPVFAQMAKKLGVEDSKSVKDVFALVCLLNGSRKGSLDELMKLAHLLGEQSDNSGEIDEQAEFNISTITPFEKVNDPAELGDGEEGEADADS